MFVGEIVQNTLSFTEQAARNVAKINFIFSSSFVQFLLIVRCLLRRLRSWLVWFIALTEDSGRRVSQ